MGVGALEAWDEPAFGPDRYMGRRQSVAALTRLLRKGAGVVVLGGARIGKTSLLRQVALEMGDDDRVLLVDDADALSAPRPGVTVCLATSRSWLLPSALAAHLKPFPMAAWD